MKKVPEINIFYWALIMSANTLGETAGDLISQTLNLGYAGATLALIVLFFIAVTVSIYLNKLQPILYWLMITLASTAGTTISDFISRSFFHLQLGFSENQGYTYATIILIVLLAIFLALWKSHANSKTLVSESKKSNEIWYWLAILTSSTLGTALGDLLAHNTPLGFDGGTLLLLACLAIVAGLYFFTKISRIFLYWLAIIFTHPIGATLGDYMTKPEGLNLGNSKASLILVFVFVLVVLASNAKNGDRLSNSIS